MTDEFKTQEVKVITGSSQEPPEILGQIRTVQTANASLPGVAGGYNNRKEVYVGKGAGYDRYFIYEFSWGNMAVVLDSPTPRSLNPPNQVASEHIRSHLEKTVASLNSPKEVIESIIEFVKGMEDNTSTTIAISFVFMVGNQKVVETYYSGDSPIYLVEFDPVNPASSTSKLLTPLMNGYIYFKFQDANIDLLDSLSNEAVYNQLCRFFEHVEDNKKETFEIIFSNGVQEIIITLDPDAYKERSNELVGALSRNSPFSPGNIESFHKLRVPLIPGKIYLVVTASDGITGQIHRNDWIKFIQTAMEESSDQNDLLKKVLGKALVINDNGHYDDFTFLLQLIDLRGNDAPVTAV